MNINNTIQDACDYAEASEQGDDMEADLTMQAREPLTFK